MNISENAITTHAFAPIREARRIDSVDVLRGVAVLGILLLNIVGMSMPAPAYNDPSGWGGDTGWNLRAWWINSVLFEGTMRTLFTLLWSGEVLYVYGLLGMFLFPFRHSSPQRLAALAATLLLVGFGLGVRDYIVARDLKRDADAAAAYVKRGEAIPKGMESAQKDWDSKREEIVPPKEARVEYVANMQGGYRRALLQRAETVFAAQSHFHVRFNYFDMLSVMFLGMALLKWRVLQAQRQTGFYAAMMLVGYGIGVPINLWETSHYAASGFDVAALYQTWITYDIGRLAVATGHLGVVLLVCRLGLLGWLRRALAATGRMALTNYVTHTVITTTVFVGFAQFGRWERYELYYLVAGIWIVQLVASPLWLRRFYFGPLEWLWRSLTYLQRQPFRRNGLGLQVPPIPAPAGP